MGAGVKPETTYSPDNPFAPKGGSPPQGYSADNPFAPTTPTLTLPPVVVTAPEPQLPRGEMMQGLRRVGLTTEQPPVAPLDQSRVGAPPANPQARQLTGKAKFASDVFAAGASVFEHPAETAVGMVTAPAKATKLLADAGVDYAAGRPITTSPKDLAIAAAQVGSLALAGPAEGAVGEMIAPYIGSRAAGLVARTAVGAGVGAAYNPERPGVGAVVGGAGGALLNEANPARPTVRRLVTNDPSRMLPEEASPRQVQATARITERPPLPEGPDYNVEGNEPPPNYSPDNPFAPRTEKPGQIPTESEAPREVVGKPATESAPTLSRADRIIVRGEGQPAVRADDGHIYTRKQAAEHGDLIAYAEESDDATFEKPDFDVRGWILDGKFVSIRDLDGEMIEGVHYTQSKSAAPKAEAPPPAPAPAPAREDLLNDYQQSQVGERERVNNATEDATRRAQFPMTVTNLLDHAEAKGTSIAESAAKLRAAGYTIPPELERDAVKQQMRSQPSSEPAYSPENPFATTEKTDLFGNAVAPTVEQGSLLGAGAGTEQSRIDQRQLARKDEAISPEEMTQRRDELGKAKPPVEQPKKVRRKPVEGAVNPKYRLDDNDTLLDRAAELEARLEEYSSGKHGGPEYISALDRGEVYDPKAMPSAAEQPHVAGTSVRHRLTQDADLYHDVVAELRARGLDEEAIEEGLAKRGRTIETGDTSFAADARAFAMGSSAARPRRVGPKPPSQQPSPAAAAAAPASNLPAGPTQATGVLGAAKAAVAPAHVSPEAARSARIIRAQAGRNALDNERAVESLNTVKKLFNSMGRQASLDAYDRAERGAHANTPADQALSAMQKMLADKRDEIINLGTGKLSQWIANYLPHIYTDATGAKTIIGKMLGKRPLEGTKSFLKHRAIPTLKDAMAQGLEPVSWNPVDLTLLKLREMNKYLMAQRILQEHKAAGLVHFVPAMEKAPDAYQRINDNVAMVYGPPSVQVNEAFDLLVRQKLKDVINGLGGLTHERKVSLGGKKLGFAMSSGDYMASKFGSQDVVIMHELGHILDFRYKLWDYLTRGKKPGAIKQELRALADLRYEGQQPGPGFKGYVRMKEEQIANAVHAFIYAPEKMDQVAPTVRARLSAFFASRPELKPILDIKPSLVMGSESAEKPVGGLVVKGQYWAPADVARVLNNYLSPGLRGRNAIYDGYMTVGNMLNQAQLGLSAFHLGFTSIDAAVSQTAVGLQNLAAGRVKMAAQQLNPLSIAAAPLTTLLRGDKLLRAYLRPHGVSPQLLKFVEAVTESGGRVRMDSFYKSGAINAMVENFRNAFQGTGLAKSQRVGAGVKMTVEAPAALLEALAKPVLEWVVPRQKLGVFMQLAEHELATLPKNATPDDVRKALDTAWDSTDDRLGQVVYDNLFWNRTGKDLSHALVRSVGWNFGDIRQLGGGVADWVKIANDAVHGRKPNFTSRAAYVLALPLVLGMIGALMTRLRSGDDPGHKKGKWQGLGFMLKDLYFPRTGRDDPDGNPERDTPPSYMRDVAAYGRHTVQTIEHKLHPEIAAVADMLQNKDFYGDQVHNPDDVWWKQRVQDAKYGLDQFTPLGVRNAREQKKRNQSATEKALGFVGVTAAPRELVRSPAQNKMADYLARRGHVSKTPEEKEQSANRSQLMDDLRSGQATRADVKAAEQRGDIKPGQGKRMLKTAKENPLVTRFKQLSAEEAQKVFELANPQEKALWAPLLRRKERAARRVGPLR